MHPQQPQQPPPAAAPTTATAAAAAAAAARTTTSDRSRTSGGTGGEYSHTDRQATTARWRPTGATTRQTVAAPIDSAWLADLLPTKGEAAGTMAQCPARERVRDAGRPTSARRGGVGILALPLAVKSAVRPSFDVEPEDEGVPPIVTSPLVATADISHQARPLHRPSPNVTSS